jgi:hypothetical protein
VDERIADLELDLEVTAKEGAQDPKPIPSVPGRGRPASTTGRSLAALVATLTVASRR